MYTIEFTTENTISERLKDVLLQAVQDEDADATCRVEGDVCVIQGNKADPEHLSYLLGIAAGCGNTNEIVKLVLSYEKMR